MSWFDGSDWKVAIRSGKTGEELCQVENPIEVRWPLPLFPLPLILYRWGTKVSPEVVEKWVWHEMLIIHAQKAIWADQIGKTCGEAPDGKASFGISFSYPCVACGQDTVVPARRKRFFRQAQTGFACSNKKCPMKGVMIPETLEEHINEIPKEYIPLGF